YRWAISNSPLDEQPIVNPVALARPKKPKPYRTERTKSLLDDELRVLITFMREKATEPTNTVAKRDYALLQWYVKTGRRRNEVIALRGSDVQVRVVTTDGASEEVLIV